MIQEYKVFGPVNNVRIYHGGGSAVFVGDEGNDTRYVTAPVLDRALRRMSDDQLGALIDKQLVARVEYEHGEPVVVQLFELPHDALPKVTS